MPCSVPARCLSGGRGLLGHVGMAQCITHVLSQPHALLTLCQEVWKTVVGKKLTALGSRPTVKLRERRKRRRERREAGDGSTCQMSPQVYLSVLT